MVLELFIPYKAILNLKESSDIDKQKHYLIAKPIVNVKYDENDPKHNFEYKSIKISEDYHLDLLDGKALFTYLKNNETPIIYELQIDEQVLLDDQNRKDCTTSYTIIWISVAIMNNLYKIRSISKIGTSNISNVINILNQLECNTETLCLIKRIFNLSPKNIKTLTSLLNDIVEFKVLENLFVFSDLKHIYKKPDTINMEFYNERIKDTIKNKAQLKKIVTRKFSDGKLNDFNVMGYLLFHLRDIIINYIKSYSGDHHHKLVDKGQRNNIPEEISSVICYDAKLWKNKINNLILNNPNLKGLNNEHKKTQQLLNFLENVINLNSISKVLIIFNMRFHGDIKETLLKMTNNSQKGGNKSKKVRKPKNKTKKCLK